MESPDGAEAPRLPATPPGRASDQRATYDQCLTELAGLVGVDCPPRKPGDATGWEWPVRRAIAEAIRANPVSETLFEPLVRTAVHDPDPSYNRQWVEHAIAAFSRRRTQAALIDRLWTGTDLERVGAARAWYWADVDLVFWSRSESQTAEIRAEYDAHADLRRSWQETALQVFVDNTDLDVRRSILPRLDLRPEDATDGRRAPAPRSAVDRELVARVIEIARTHPDAGLRHQVEVQIESG